MPETLIRSDAVPIEGVEVSVLEIPTESPESDGTLEWSKTTMVIAEAVAGGMRSLGYTYADRGAGTVITEQLAKAVTGLDALDVPSCWVAMTRAIRNLGRSGVAAMAVSALDASLWDLKARLLGVSLAKLLGQARPCVDVYGSGGFTSYSITRLREQLGGWVASGIPRVKMKVGRRPDHDVERVGAVRESIGDAQLFVDANGAYSRTQALQMAASFADLGVAWFEEPVSSDDLEGLRLIRDRGPAGMDIASGEYGYDAYYFRRMIEAGAVDVLQADATRCAISGFLRADALCDAWNTPLSAHCAPSVHAHVACATPRVRHIEYFYDHARIEKLVFDGTLEPRQGALHPDRARPGLGIEFKRADARRFMV